MCVEKIRLDAGQHFDPDIVAVFLSIQHEFREIAARFAVFETDFLAQNHTSSSGDVRNYAEMRNGADLSAATKSRILDLTLSGLDASDRSGAVTPRAGT